MPHLRCEASAAFCGLWPLCPEDGMSRRDLYEEALSMSPAVAQRLRELEAEVRALREAAEALLAALYVPGPVPETAEARLALMMHGFGVQEVRAQELRAALDAARRTPPATAVDARGCSVVAGNAKSLRKRRRV